MCGGVGVLIILRFGDWWDQLLDHLLPQADLELQIGVMIVDVTPKTEQV